MRNVADLVGNFIRTQKQRFTESEEGRLLIGSQLQVLRYCRFLEIIKSRYLSFGRQHRRLMKAHRGLFPAGDNTITKERQSWIEGINANFRSAELEIESYYLFAKILLDKIACALKFCFGSARGLSLDNHHKLIKEFPKYCEGKGLRCPSELPAIQVELRERISDFRDHQIAHDASPRTARATSFRGGSGASMEMFRIPPKTKDKRYQSEPLGQLHDKICSYVEMVIRFIEDNESKTCLRLKE